MTSTNGIALVTGASSGIGEALAERLAGDGQDLILVARRRDRLEQLAGRLAATHGVAADVLVADLTSPADVALVEERIAAEERLELVVNNAGFAGYRPFADVDPAVPGFLVGVHVVAPLRLTRAALPGMVARGHGAVVNVASLLALSGPLRFGMTGHATYAGAKAFLLTFTQLLAQELEGTGVAAMVCLPGMVASEFHDFMGGSRGMPLMAAADVAAAIVRGLELGEVVCVPGLEDVGLVQGLADAQQALFSGNDRVTPAVRYRT